MSLKTPNHLPIRKESIAFSGVHALGDTLWEKTFNQPILPLIIWKVYHFNGDGRENFYGQSRECSFYFDDHLFTGEFERVFDDGDSFYAFIALSMASCDHDLGVYKEGLMNQMIGTYQQFPLISKITIKVAVADGSPFYRRMDLIYLQPKIIEDAEVTVI